MAKKNFKIRTGLVLNGHRIISANSQQEAESIYEKAFSGEPGKLPAS